jgi:hypothetical protein
LQNLLFELALQYEWDLQAWALLSNHYHFIALSAADAGNLKRFIRHFHVLPGDCQVRNRTAGSAGRLLSRPEQAPAVPRRQQAAALQIT